MILLKSIHPRSQNFTEKVKIQIFKQRLKLYVEKFDRNPAIVILFLPVEGTLEIELDPVLLCLRRLAPTPGNDPGTSGSQAAAATAGSSKLVKTSGFCTSVPVPTCHGKLTNQISALEILETLQFDSLSSPSQV